MKEEKMDKIKFYNCLMKSIENSKEDILDNIITADVKRIDVIFKNPETDTKYKLITMFTRKQPKD